MDLSDEFPGLKSGDTLLRRSDKHLFAIIPTDELGIDSGRRRYRVQCESCMIVIHPGSTSALAQIDYHLQHPTDAYPGSCYVTKIS